MSDTRRSQWARGASALAGCLAVACGVDGMPSEHGGLEPSAAPSPAPAIADERPVQTPASPPPPITGGTLLVTRDGQLAVAADPARDRVSVVSIPERRLVRNVALQRGDEPGRLVQGVDSQVHVALRRGGAVVTLDLGTGDVLRRDPVCGAPRGLAYDAATEQLHVACAGGQLVTLAAATGDVVRSLDLDVDLRDVLVRPDGLTVTRFKSAEVLSLSHEGTITQRIALAPFARRTERLTFAEHVESSIVEDRIEPAVAWRALQAPDGSVRVLHQYALAEPIDLEEPEDGAIVSPAGSSPYGAGSFGAPTCGGIVQAGLSTVDANGTVHMGAPLVAPVLAVDATVSPDGRWLAVAHAGTPDPGSPSGFGTLDGHVSIVAAVGPELDGLAGCTLPTTSVPLPAQTTAVAFNPATDVAAQATGTWIVAQARDPARLIFLADAFGNVNAIVELGGSSLRDTGHDLFHRDTGSGIACASCHVEGNEDGRVWQFEPIGPRRTQALHVGLEGMAPFHWDGDMESFGMLMDEVFIGRMGGAPQSAARVEALRQWTFSLRPPPPIRAHGAPEVERGRVLFESAAVGCAGCHAGRVFSNNQSAQVGTTEAGHRLQVPSLVGIGYRAPFLHDGCAPTLTDRFEPNCGGGDAHGTTSQLTGVEVQDLVAYLQSL